jgi:hypothetical protein
MGKFIFFRGREPRLFEKYIPFLEVRNPDLLNDVLECAFSYITDNHMMENHNTDYLLPILYRIFKDKNTIPRNHALMIDYPLNNHQSYLTTIVINLSDLIIYNWELMYSVIDSQTHHTNLDYEAELCSTIAEHLNWVETI